MPDGRDRHFSPVEETAHVEHLASIGSRVNRKEDKNQRDKERRRRKAGIEKTLQEEKDQLDKQSSPEDGHIDYHA